MEPIADQVAQAQLQSPAPRLQGDQFLGGVVLGVQEGGDQRATAGGEAADGRGEADNACGNNRRITFAICIRASRM